MKPNVLQHQYAITTREVGTAVLSTKGILICTGWYGWDSKNGIAFLCHFDWPKSADSVPEILKELRRVSPVEHRFKSILVGGKSWCWSKITRKRVKKYLTEQNELNISIKDGPLDDPFCRHRDLFISSTGGHLKDQPKLSGKSFPSDFGWFFRPMQKVNTDA